MPALGAEGSRRLKTIPDKKQRKRVQGFALLGAELKRASMYFHSKWPR